MTTTPTVMQEVQQKRAEQRELENWLDATALNENTKDCGHKHSPGSKPKSCVRCVTLNEWDRLNNSITRLLRYGVK